MRYTFREFLDYVVIKDKNSDKVIYPDESWKKSFYNRYKAFKKLCRV